MAFIGLQGQLPKFGPLQGISREQCLPRPQLSLAHLTSVPPFIKGFKEALKAHQAFASVALSNWGVHRVETRRDFGANGIGILFGMQYAPKELRFADMQQFKNAGLRVMSLAYDATTEYGGGFKEDGPLTVRGMKLVEWMSRCGILLDLSHAGHMTARGALGFIRQEHLPMKPMASHSGCHSVYPHPRNLPDDVLEGIARLGGYVGIPLITFYLGKNGTNPLAEFTRHVTHALSVMGKDKVGIGSDSNHMDMSMSEAIKHFENTKLMLKSNGTFGEYFPDRPPEIIEHGSCMFKVLAQKLQTGNTLILDPGIMGQNFKDFLKRSLPQA